MGFVDSIKSFFSRFFSRDPEVARRRTELRRLYAILIEQRPPYYRPKQNLVLPSFAEVLYSFAILLRPLAELARATVANSDVRVSQRYFDYLIECRLPAESRERRASFNYEGMVERLRGAIDPDREMELLGQEFQAFLRELEGLGAKNVNDELAGVDRLIEVIRHDYERLLGLFDPGVSLETSGRRPEFAATEGEAAAPELIDLYYVLDGFSFSPLLRDNIFRLFERRSAAAIDEGRKKKVEKIFAQLEKLLESRLDPALILVLVRVTKGDPYFVPSTPRERRDFFESYRKRLTQQFEKDRERLQRERHEGAVAADIKALFGDIEVLEIDGYNDETDSYLRRESPNSLAWIKPLRVLKTFIVSVFDSPFREAIKRILVEGYFDNKLFQNNLANVLYQCERSAPRIAEFEAQMSGNGRISVTALKRYVEELRRGKDIASFLNRLVDEMNSRARQIVEDEVGLLSMLSESLTDLLSDFRKASPDLVTNIRTLGGGRNKEILGQLQAGRDKLAVLVKVMRNFTIVKPPVIPSGQLAASADEDATPVEEL